MSYSKTTWETGDTITAQLLNHAEDGIAANDAAIAAIPAGLQLYGPYHATGSDTVDGFGSKTIQCQTLEDQNGISVNYPDTSTGAKVFLIGAKTDRGLLQGFMVPRIGELGPLGTVWIDGEAIVYNNTETSLTAEIQLTLYSTVEFPQES